MWSFLFYGKDQFRGNLWILEFSYSEYQCYSKKKKKRPSGNCMNEQCKGSEVKRLDHLSDSAILIESKRKVQFCIECCICCIRKKEAYN